jgi:hypothetical protein
MNWDTLDWPTLDRLRETFLAGKPGDYWRSTDDLANYDFTYAQRIGWKWDAVLAELKRLGWRPAGDLVLDWGCGSGIAGRKVRDFFGLKTLRVWDRSALAMEYAAQAGNATRWGGEAPGLVVLSHVLNEVREVPAVVLEADAVLWVEPGTRADSRALGMMREQLRDRLHVVAPCPHREACGMFAPENDRHWCHFFAPPPKGIMGDGNWVRFAQRAGIDLRSLPYSYLALDRQPLPVPASRVIGLPRIYKGYALPLTCTATGVADVRVQKRDAPELYKAWKDAGR